jgi:hypothetical protein
MKDKKVDSIPFSLFFCYNYCRRGSKGREERRGVKVFSLKIHNHAPEVIMIIKSTQKSPLLSVWNKRRVE